jgi:hypothetical protein
MLPTLITTNCVHLVGIEGRVASRLSDRGLSRIITMDQAIDYRPGNDVEEEEEEIARLNVLDGQEEDEDEE